MTAYTSYFEQQLATRPDSMAITDLRSERSWRQLDHNVNALANFLKSDIGLKPADHIALMIGNRVEYIEALLGGMLAGLWVTPINTHLTRAEVDYIRRDCGAKVIFFDDDHEDLLENDSTGATYNIQPLIDRLAAETLDNFIGPDDVAGGGMLYTSGTTGKPKGVQRAKPDTIREMITRLSNLGSVFGLTGRGPHMVTGPLYHAAPGWFATYDLINGAPMVIMPKWDCDTFFDCVRKFRVVTTHLVPTMFVRLLDAREKKGGHEIDLSSLEYVLHGAAPISKAVKQKMVDWWGPILTEYWGATESGVVTLVNSAEWANHPGTVGRAIANFEVYVGDEKGNPTGEREGLLYCRHKNLEQVFAYHNDPEKTRKAHPQPYVLSLGDIGRVDDEGFVYLSDRESHMIISGGVNIYPSEVEQALTEHDEIADAAVFGIPNDEWGEEVKAVVQLRAGVVANEESEQKYRDFVRTKIAGFKVPRSIEFVAELPRNPTGKVLIRQLKEQYSGAGA